MADVIARPGSSNGHPDFDRSSSTPDPRTDRTQWWLLLPIALLSLVALIGPLLDLNPTAQNLVHRLQPPVGFGGTWDQPFGSDSLGRDVLARMLTGTRLSLLIGLMVAMISSVIGVSLGLLAGIIGGWVDDAITAMVEVTLAVPTIVVGLVVAATLGQSFVNLVAILVLSAWITLARVLRLQSRQVMQSDFVLAAQSIGSGQFQIARRHVLPNVMPQIVVVFCQQVAAIIIWEASLTYLGIGLPIERISLGGLIRDGQQHLFDAPWLGIVPGLFLAWAVIAFSLLAEWLQLRFAPGGSRRGW